jgi:hypothetical protein
VNVALVLGANALTVRATDVTGNSSETTRTIVRLPVDSGESVAPGLSLALASDTGASGTDRLTRDPAVAGRDADLPRHKRT